MQKRGSRILEARVVEESLVKGFVKVLTIKRRRAS